MYLITNRQLQYVCVFVYYFLFNYVFQIMIIFLSPIMKRPNINIFLFRTLDTYCG